MTVAKPLLICIPFAGAGASVYTPWIEALHEEFDVVALDLPGHERRFGREPYCRNVADAVSSMVPRVIASIGDSQRVTVFGHCLGALLSFELVRSLEPFLGVRLERLIVSGSASPFCHRRTTVDS